VVPPVLPSFVRSAPAPRRLLRLLPAFVVLLAGGAAATLAQSVELGRPPLRQFPPGSQKIPYLIQSVQQDPAGYIYIAGHAAHHVFDGDTWPALAAPPASAGARRAARTADGTIYYAGAGLIGFLRGSGPAAELVSLADRLPPTALGCDDLHDVAALGDTVWFADEEKILRWRGGQFHVLPLRSPPRSRGPRLHVVGDTVYAATFGLPLRRIVGDQLEVVSADPLFLENEIVLAEPDPAGGLRLLTARRGFFRLADGRVAPLDAEPNRWLADRIIWRALRLRDGSLAVIFSSIGGDGGMRFDPAGRYVGPLDQTIGLYLRELRDLFEDREGGLWLGSDVGLFRLEWPSPLSRFDAINGLGGGTVADLVRHAGALYVASTEGLFRLLPSTADGRVARFERVLREPVTSVLSHASGLLALGFDGLRVLTAAGWQRVPAAPAGDGILVAPTPDSPRIWIATTDGVRSASLDPAGTWREDTPSLPFAATARSLRRAGDGALVVTPAEGPPFRLVFAADGAPVRAPAAASDLPDAATVAECTSAAAPGARWLATAARLTLVAADGRELRRLPHLTRRAAGPISFLREENTPAGSVLWLGASRGLLRVDLAPASPAPTPYAARLTATGVRAGERLPTVHAALRFDYIALRHALGDTVTYRTRLAGLDNEWTDWSAERTRSFARLPPGSYRFEVEARDAAGVPAAPAALAFSVAAPWWRTVWAFSGYAALAAAAVLGFVRHRTRALRARAERLEAVVAERTRELAHTSVELATQNAELLRLHRLDLDEKVAARLAEEKARLEVLRYQLNPHFLFNTLASISAALPAGAGTARGMVERLADFCRLTLHRADDREWTTLGEELALLRAYLDIELSRWGDLLDLEFDFDAALADVRLPHFLLLPLVENALKYGRATSRERVGLRLSARRDPASGDLLVTVANTGTWVEPAAPRAVSSLGIGLENLRARLARHYPRAHALTVEAAAGWVTVFLRLSAPPRLD
jgi:signal transduction histidine kinase